MGRGGRAYRGLRVYLPERMANQRKALSDITYTWGRGRPLHQQLQGRGPIAPRGGHWAVQGSQPSREGNQGGPVTPQACSSRLPAQGKPCWSPRPAI